MAREKKILVKDILDLMGEDEEVVIQFFAYGIHYANSTGDDLKTVKDCKEELAYDFRNAQVGRIKSVNGKVVIGAEIVHK